MYLEGNVIRAIGRLVGIHNSVVSKIIKKYGKEIKEKMIKEVNKIPNDLKDIKENIQILEIDEMVTYVKKT